MRDKIKKFVTSNGVTHCDVWSGTEFEEFLRRDAEPLLKRFIDGESFPDSPSDLRAFAHTSDRHNDQETLALMARLFDRPAFYTPIHEESNLPAFKQALTDTIQGIGTGIWVTREGREIARIPSRHDLKDAALRMKIQTVEQAIAKLRAKFDAFVNSGTVRHCSCQDPDCSVYFIPPAAASELEQLRHTVLHLFRDAYPPFQVPASI